MTRPKNPPVCRAEPGSLDKPYQVFFAKHPLGTVTAIDYQAAWIKAVAFAKKKEGEAFDINKLRITDEFPSIYTPRY